MGSRAGVALGEVVALEQLRHRGGPREAEEVLHLHVQPLAVAAHLGAFGVEDREGLALEGLGVLIDLLAGENGPVGRAPAGVSHARGVVAHDQDNGVAQVLELAQLAQDHGVAEVDVGRGGIDPELHAQRPALSQLALQCALREGVDGIPGKEAGGLSRGIRHRRNARLLAVASRVRSPSSQPPGHAP